jgi:hypothetical protein
MPQDLADVAAAFSSIQVCNTDIVGPSAPEMIPNLACQIEPGIAIHFEWDARGPKYFLAGEASFTQGASQYIVIDA